MSDFDMISYFMTLVAIALAPGPVVLMLMVRSASSDLIGAAWFGIGVAFGAVLIISAVCFGLSTWLTATPQVLEYCKYIMMAYIIWMAWDVWKKGFDMNGDCDTKPRSIGSSFIAGLITCFLSPYMMILFPLVLPELMDITIIEMPEYLIIALTTFLAFLTGAVLVVGFASQLRRLARSERSMLIMNRSLATVLVAAVGWMALT